MSNAAPPPGFIAFAMHYPGDVVSSAAATIGDDKQEDVEAVNLGWNRALRYGGDPKAPWKVAHVGDVAACHDYAITKRRSLVMSGFPPGALSLCWLHRDQDGAGDPANEDHLVLLARFESGIYVLDNCDDRLLSVGFDDTYEWRSRQAWGEPMVWVTMDDRR